MHVPKTSGISLSEALRTALQPARAFRGFDRVLFGDYDDFASLGGEIASQVCLRPEDLPAADLVVGHIAYSSLRQRFPDGQMMTVLRDPVSRLLSHWLYWRGHSDEQLAPWGAWGARVKQSRRKLAEFLQEPSIAFHTDNLTVRMLLWPHPLVPVNGFIDPAHGDQLLAEARARLLDFQFLGVVENQRLFADLSDWLGMAVDPLRLNETNPIPLHLRESLTGELSAKALEQLHRCSRLDLALWHEVAERTVHAGDAGLLRQSAMMRNVARYAEMMAA